MKPFIVQVYVRYTSIYIYEALYSTGIYMYTSMYMKPCVVQVYIYVYEALYSIGIYMVYIYI